MGRTKTEAPDHSTYIVQNQSNRLDVPILAVAVHTTESSDIPHSWDDIRSIRNWFNNPASQASSHNGIDGEGHTEVWVRSPRKAWTIGAANSWTLNIEFIGRAAQPSSNWEEIQVKTGAKWAAYWGLKYDIPAARGDVGNHNGLCVCTKKGVIRHKDVTDAGFGTHVDPGPSFPMEDFIAYMDYYKQNGWFVERTRV